MSQHLVFIDRDNNVISMLEGSFKVTGVQAIDSNYTVILVPGEPNLIVGYDEDGKQTEIKYYPEDNRVDWG